MTGPFERNGHHLPTSNPGAAPRPLGLVVGGSLTGGVEVRLDGDVSIEEVKAGTFVTIQGQRQRFFGVVTDLALSSADQRLKHSPPDQGDSFLAEVVGGTVAYGSVTVLPQLTLPAVLGDDAEAPAAAKTIPGHFARVFAASPADVAQVFGGEDGGHFWIGSPLDMEAKVCLNLDELVKRSIGVFGKSGTGKTFLTRLLLVGILQGGKASSLIFDMHSEYGVAGADADRNIRVKGLKELFGDRVSTFTLDEAHSRRRNSFPDEVARIGYHEIEPEDVELLRETLNLSDVAASAAYNLQQRFGRDWLREFLNLQGRSAVTDLAEEIQVNSSALSALHNRLSRLKRFGFLTEQTGQDTAARMVEHLERGKHVVLEFGQYGDNLTAYILVSNLLTRRIHDRYVELKDAALGGQGREPRPLVIVIEEAHKFLNPAVAGQTIFGVIARELRKYNVTLMVIDQRPGAIDTEVLSQVGTRLTCLLDNEHDIDAALAGMPGGRQLRSVLARLEPKQQALIFGHAVPMPVVIRTREYGSEASYVELLAGARRQSGASPAARPGETHAERVKREIDELF